MVAGITFGQYGSNKITLANTLLRDLKRLALLNEPLALALRVSAHDAFLRNAEGNKLTMHGPD